MDGFIELTPDMLSSPQGAIELNRMLRALFDTMPGDGNAVKIYKGYGSPEGVVAANAGSIYMRLDGDGTTSKPCSYIKAGTGATGWSQVNVGTTPVSGTVVQVVSTETGEVATGTTVIPLDNTIPQITEGHEYMTLAITPKSATNILRIEVVFNYSSDIGTNTITTALFQNATSDSLACAGLLGGTGSADKMQNLSFSHYMIAGTTSAATFRVRAGASTTGIVTFNGITGARIYGGVLASSITIMEVQV